MFMLSDIHLSRTWIVGLLGVHVAGVVFLLGLSIWKITLPVLFSHEKEHVFAAAARHGNVRDLSYRPAIAKGSLKP